jgi:hypothetical protein
MPRKAQAEFALILGIVIIAVFVAIYSMSSMPPPTVDQSAMTDDQKEVVSFATDIVRDATSSTVSELYRNGGYLDGSDPLLGSVSHSGFGTVAYWQMCENKQVPDMEANLKEGIRKYIDENLPATVSFAGKQATFAKSSLSVATRMYDNRVAVSVNLPTVYDGASLPQPYNAEVDTKISRIYSFSKNFALMQADLRMLDNNLIYSLIQSSEYSSCFIPFGMGNAVMRHTLSWQELKDCMEMHIKYSLTNTQVGREVPMDENDKIASFEGAGWDGSATEFFFMPAVNTYDPITGQLTGSDRYEDLSVSFYFGDEDGLDNTEFSAPESIEIKPPTGSFVEYLGSFSALQYSETYSVRYPVIVRVWDEASGESMKFALQVYMKDNDIGTGCSAQTVLSPAGGGDPTYDERCGSGATLWSRVVVEYDDGTPVQNANVYYAGCHMGKTDQLGAVSARVSPQLLSALTVNVGENEYSECHGSDDITMVTMTIPRSSDYTFIFKKVPVTKSASTYTMSPPVALSAEDKDIATVEFVRDTNACDLSTAYVRSADEDGNSIPTKFVRNFPDGEYAAGVTLQSGEDVMGFANLSGFVPSGTEVYVYVPSMEGFKDSADATEIENLRSLFLNCGIDEAISSNLQTGGSCTWTKV